MNIEKRLRLRHKKRIRRVKGKIVKRPDIFRLTVFRGNKNLYAQIIDDINGLTKVAASTTEKEFSDKENRANIESAVKLGQLIADRAKEKNIAKVVFDRRGLLYHGKIKAFANAVREKGLIF